MQAILDRDPDLMASQHRAAGMQCQACHAPFPPTGTPPNETCLPCHTGSYAKLAELTPGRMNPHQSHMGELSCAYCHGGHETLVSQCTQCKHKSPTVETEPGQKP